MGTFPSPGGEFAGYRIEKVLGRGGMGVVYLAEHSRLRRKVALKVLPPELAEDERFRERFIRESELAASLDDPNVIPIYEAGEQDGVLFIAMRYVDGRDLKELIEREGPLEPHRVAAIVGQVASALDAAHGKGLVHRDVKPGNVLVAPRSGGSVPTEHVYLTDFGLTKRAASDSGLTGTGVFVGSLNYAAPEQFEGGTLDGRTDVYSLGCVLFESLTGVPPFRKDQDAALMHAHLHQAPPSATALRPELPPAVDPVIERAMAKRPDQRYPTAGGVAGALRDAVTGAGAAGEGPRPGRRSPRVARRGRGDRGGRHDHRRRRALAGGRRLGPLAHPIGVGCRSRSAAATELGEPDRSRDRRGDAHRQRRDRARGNEDRGPVARRGRGRCVGADLGPERSPIPDGDRRDDGRRS